MSGRRLRRRSLRRKGEELEFGAELHLFLLLHSPLTQSSFRVSPSVHLELFLTRHHSVPLKGPFLKGARTMFSLHWQKVALKGSPGADGVKLYHKQSKYFVFTQSSIYMQYSTENGI